MVDGPVVVRPNQRGPVAVRILIFQHIMLAHKGNNKFSIKMLSILPLPYLA